MKATNKTPQQKANKSLLVYLLQHMSAEEISQQTYLLDDETTHDMYKNQGDLLFDDALLHLQLLKNHNKLHEVSIRKSAKNSEYCSNIFED